MERQQLAAEPEKLQSSFAFKCTLSIISCPTTLTCCPCNEFTLSKVHLGPRVCGVISATTLVLSIGPGLPNMGFGLVLKICCASAGSKPMPIWKS